MNRGNSRALNTRQRKYRIARRRAMREHVLATKAAADAKANPTQDQATAGKSS